MNRKPFVTDQYYHIYNRGTDHRYIFNDTDDYKRFIFSLIEFNTNFPVIIRECRKVSKVEPLKPQEAEPLVEIVSWALMPNHFHLLIRQVEDGGITKFLQKLMTGYTMYFNLKNRRNGVLFQGATKSVNIETDIQLLHLSRYIYLNPLDLYNLGWKEKGIDWTEAKQHVFFYPWSNIHDFLNYKKDHIILGQFSSLEGYEKFLSEWTEKDFRFMDHYALED